MRPSRDTARHLAESLDRLLSGRRVERIWRPGADLVLIDVGRALESQPKARLLIDVTPRHPRVVLTTRWPETPSAPDRETLAFRGALENQRIAGAVFDADRRLVVAIQPSGRRLVVQLAGRYPNVAVIDGDGAVMQALHADRPAADDDSPPLPLGPLFAAELAVEPPDDTWHLALADASWADADARAIDARRTELGRRIRTQLARDRRTAERLEAQLAEAEAAEHHLRLGELLKTVARLIPPKATSARVTDWYSEGQPELEIPLDPARSGIENMELHFRRYRKLLRTREEAETRLVALWDRLETLGALETEASEADDDAALVALEARAEGLGLGAPRESAPDGGQRRRIEPRGERLPYRRFVAADGSEIWLGRSARDNDAMTFRHARGHDTFLHARDVAGSHVILRARGKSEPPHPEAILDAATLAAWHSKARQEGVVAVMITPRKHVRKGKGFAPGRVSVAASRNLDVRLDKERLDRIYARSGEASE